MDVMMRERRMKIKPRLKTQWLCPFLLAFAWLLNGCSASLTNSGIPGANPAAPPVSATPTPSGASNASGLTVLYTDLTSGPNSGGEGNHGSYLTIYGSHFGTSQGASTVTINGQAVAQYILWSETKIGVQVGAVSSGPIVVTVGGVASNSDKTFTVRSGHLYFIGATVDTSAPASCATMLAANSYATPWGLTNYSSTTEGNYNSSTMRTPFTYYSCLSPGDTLVFLNGRGWHASLTLDNGSTTASSFMTIMARPGATVTLGGEGFATYGIRNTGASTYSVYSGLTLIGSGSNGNAISPDSYDRIVGNTVRCPDCSGPQGAFSGGTGNLAYGNTITQISTDTTALPNGSNKTYHAVYFQGNGFEFAWNRIYNTAAYNGFQINEDSTSGFYNFSIHDNDIADVNGSGINLSDIDPASGYVKVYNNVIHHTGLALASDGGSDDPHSCISVKGYGSATGTGTAQIYNNTMFDCSSYLNAAGASFGEGESCAIFIPPNQLNVTTNLVNNVVYQPSYTYSGNYNLYICGDGSAGTISGSHNLWYSVSTPGSTAYATTVGTIANPQYVSATNGAATNFELQSTSPAKNSGVAVSGLTTDFNGSARPNPPSIGAFEYGTSK
jgi:hypothetical protein